MSHTCKLIVWGIPLDIEYDVSGGTFKGSLEEPPEYPEIDIVEVAIGGESVGERHLSKDFEEAIQEAVHVYESERSYDGDDDRDSDRYEY